MNDPAQYPPYPNTPETQLLQSLGKNSRTYFYREIDSNKQFVLMNNENAVYGISEATGYASMIPRCLYTYTTIGHWHDSGLVTPRFLGKFNIGTLARVKPLPFDSLQLETSGPVWIYKNLLVWPRAYLAHMAITCGNDSIALRHMADSALGWPVAYFTPDQQAIPINISKIGGDTVAISEDANNAISIMASSPDSSYLILTDTYYPGWKATIDGNPTQVLRCNYAMRAVLLPPGQHKIEMHFGPVSFRTGMWTSLATLFILTLTGIRSIRADGKIEERRSNNFISHLRANSDRIRQ